LVVFSLFYFIFIRVTPMEKYHLTNLQEAQTDYSTSSVFIERYEQSKSLPAGGLEELNARREQQFWRRLDLIRLQFHLDVVFRYLLMLGLAMLGWVGIKHLRSQHALQKDEDFDSMIQVTDAIPREEYVDEWEFKRRMEDGFFSREEAIQWISKDPYLQCDYCGSRLQSAFSGDPQQLEFVTYYKKVPNGATDMRIILGSRWYAKSATELKCVGCNRVIRR